MGFLSGLSAVLAFRTVPTTIFLAVIYAVIFSAVLVTDQLPSVPKRTLGLDFQQAYADLHEVAARPHPFNSHANEIVRSYILNRVKDVASSHGHVSVDFDLSSNASWASGLLSTNPYAVYYESDNVLVKIEGSDKEYRESGGLLLSAHWDSVSTAPGATDDGMGVVTLLSMVKYFAENRPKRTVVFNINNGEEDGLNGANVFMEHLWAKIPDTFLNLEGAAAGGRPLLFRVTSRAPLASWSGSHPHANVITSDAFKRGVVRSGTDYSVYEEFGLKGLDFAFYRGRSRYHTKYDSIPGMAGDQSKNSLWAMMEGTLSSSLVLANDIKGKTRNESAGRASEPVYFDLFGMIMIVFTFQTLRIVNIVLLTVGPVILLMSVYFEHIVRVTSRIRSGYYRAANDDVNSQNFVACVIATVKNVIKGCFVWSKFWIALLLGVGFQLLLVVGYAKVNPFVIHTHPWLVFVSALSLAYLTTVLAVTFPLTKHGVVPAPEQQKLSILLHQYVLTWALLVYTTSALTIGGTYFITVWNAVVLLGSVLACIEGMTGAQGFEDEEERRARYVRGIRYEAVSNGEYSHQDAENGHQDSGEVEDAEPTEITPLVAQRSEPAPSSKEQGAIGWWIVQLLLVVPLPVILASHIAIIVLFAVNQTLTDGNSPFGVYETLSIMALFIVLPIAPFSMNMHRWLNGIVLIIFVLSTLYTYLAFPFSQETPLKIYFAQSVDLDTSRVVTALTGPRQFLSSAIIPRLPSAYNQVINCTVAPDKLGLQTCKWEVGDAFVPSPGGGKDHHGLDIASSMKKWVSTSIERTGSDSAHIKVHGLNTRSCTLQFSGRRARDFNLTDDNGKGVRRGSEVEQIRLWSRDWEKEFEVDVDFAEGVDEKIKGRVSCGWAEYESATVGGGRTGGKIPSLEEVILFLPEWAVVTKSSAALFDASREFEV
ncbi:Zn-dependent exopeptidase [Rhizopogon vinicolor AM-OR11-026]|uniref:Peptide hydrolase n=1 Tax=Rhizopogon vinicolor AM-OR11-026 TaxID=1314800 RepID=A0A1B7MUS2_9AGAM|nr:Zn-dependent exopeptidase [Rhizopogon vinicolor AM-OR11-026]